MKVPYQGRSIIARRFNESLGYFHSSLRDPRFFLSCLSWFLFLAGSVLAEPITVLDRIGINSASTDGNPGGLTMHYAHGTSNELWGTAGTVWTQPFNGALGEVAFVGFARVVNPTNGMYLDPITNLDAFSMSVHLWTNGAAGFLAGTNPAHGDLVFPLGPGPAAPPRFGVTSVTNTVVNSTNLYVSVLPTFRLATNLAASNVRLLAPTIPVPTSATLDSSRVSAPSNPAFGSGGPPPRSKCGRADPHR